MSRFARRIAVGVVALLATTAGAVAVNPAPAAAATTCYTWQFKEYDPAFRVKAQVPAAGSSFTCVLGLNNTGPAVEMLQLSLIYCNNADLSPGWIDGIYGPKTRDVILWIQAANGIPADGVYGPQTRGVMKWLWRGGSNNICLPWP